MTHAEASGIFLVGMVLHNWAVEHNMAALDSLAVEGCPLSTLYYYTLSNHHMTTGFGSFDLLTLGLLQKGRRHSPGLFQESSCWICLAFLVYEYTGTCRYSFTKDSFAGHSGLYCGDFLTVSNIVSS